MQKSIDYGTISIQITGNDSDIEEINRVVSTLKLSSMTVYEDSRDIDLLSDTFKQKVKNVLSRCQHSGYVFKPFFTIRTLVTQAKLWRQSRPTQEIQRMIRKLESEDADYLASIIRKVGPQTGRWATNAVPGQSWHQWGKAVDCFLVSPNGRAIWSAKHAGYECYAQKAQAEGLTAGFYFGHADVVHIQEPIESSPRDLHSWKEINDAMKERFGS